jgi:hypothetical protein
LTLALKEVNFNYCSILSKIPIKELTIKSKKKIKSLNTFLITKMMKSTIGKAERKKIFLATTHCTLHST